MRALSALTLLLGACGGGSGPSAAGLPPALSGPGRADPALTAAPADGERTPVSSSPPSWTAGSVEAEDGFGYATEIIGDVNGDGYEDVAVGAPDDGGFDHGAVYVFHGSATGPGASADWSVSGDQAGAWFGAVLARAGDVNGDGYDDLLVSAGAYDNGHDQEGRVYLYLGSASGLGASSAWTMEWNQANAELARIAGGGDVNGDGYDDLLLGAAAWNAGAIDSGRASLYLGGPSGPGSTAAWTATSGGSDDMLGYSLAFAGDVNGDGYDDVLVGVPGQDGAATRVGAARLYLGNALGLGASPAWTVAGTAAYGELGRTVAAAGDVNADGYADVVVASSMYTETAGEQGGAWLYLGSASGPGSTAAWSVIGEGMYQWLGESVAHLDWNVDGYEDLVLGSAGWSNGEESEGAVQIWFGSAAGLDPSVGWSAESDVAGRYAGWTVATGDVDGDGVGDLLTSALPLGWGQVELHLGTASPEICDGLDNDGDGLVDDDDPSLSADTWYLDTDGDGYGETGTGVGACAPPVGAVTNSLDCDDADPAVHPGVLETCDGVDNDCSGDEDGLATWVAPDGTETDWTGILGAGAEGAPTTVTLPNAGTLNVCRGTWYVNLVAGSGSLDVVGHDPSVWLSAGGSGRVLNVNSPAADLSLTGVTLTDGVVTTGSGTGGCVRQSAGTLRIVDSEVSSCTAVSGGGIYVAGGTLELDGVAVSRNDATDGAGLYLAGGSFTATESWFGANWATNRGGGVYTTVGFTATGVDWEDNHATDGGGLYTNLPSGTVTVVDSLFNQNVASNRGGGAYLTDSDSLVCSATPSGSFGFLRNSATVGGGGVYMAGSAGRLRSTFCDWGATVGANNRPADIQLGAASYNKGDNASFLCGSGLCP